MNLNDFSEQDWKQMKGYARQIAVVSELLTPAPFWGINAMLLCAMAQSVECKKPEVEWNTLRHDLINAVNGMFDLCMQTYLEKQNDDNTDR